MPARTPIEMPHARSSAALIIASALGLGACRGAERSSEPRGAPGAALAGVGQDGVYAFELSPRPDPPIVGELFEIVTRIRDARTGAPIEGAAFSLSAAMPEHGHGMTTAPAHRELGGGDYLSEGMKFHMPGAWMITARAAAAGRGDRISLRFEQPPRVR